jgi:hypothetical protein
MITKTQKTVEIELEYGDYINHVEFKVEVIDSYMSAEGHGYHYWIESEIEILDFSFDTLDPMEEALLTQYIKDNEETIIELINDQLND